MTPKTKQVIFPLITLILFAAIASIFMANKKEPEKKPSKSTEVFVKTQLAESHPHQFSIQSQGMVHSRYNTTIVSQVNGEIIKVSDTFNKGGFIKKGELLVQVDPFNYQVRVQQAQASLAVARATFILERAQGQVAEAEWAKISQSEPSELGLRKPQQEQALAAVKAAQASVKQAQKDLQRTKIVAPYSALIEERHLSLGSYVNIGSPVAQVMDISVAEVRLPITQRDYTFLKDPGIGAKVTLTSLVDGDSKSWQASISRVEGMIDSSSRMIHVIASINTPYQLSMNEPKEILPFGTYVSATIQGKTIENAVTVARQVLRDEKIPLAVNGELQFKPVSVTRHEGKMSIITGGLNDGDRMIISALEYPTEGMKIHWNGSQVTPPSSEKREDY